MSIFVQLLGTPRVHIGRRWLTLPADRPSGLLVYLAARGDWVARDELCNLLWSEASQSAAHNSLRQVLIRTHKLPYARALEVRPERLRFDVPTDLNVFAQAVAGHDWAGAIRAYSGEFCAGLHLRGTIEYQDWLERERERNRTAWHQAAIRRAQDLEHDGQFEDATGLLERVLEADPLSEDAMSAWLRVATLGGHRDVALERFERFCVHLRDDLGLAPLAATLKLVDSIRHGELASPSPLAKTALRAVSKAWPPRLSPLVGRASEWAKMEAAWDAAQIIVITGEAGVGKTRLMLEFATSKGAYQLVDGRPGDVSIPFATFIRHLRHLLGAQPNLALPEWVHERLTRLVTDEEQTVTSSVPGEQVHLFDTAIELALIGHRNEIALLADALHFFDLSSLELAAHGVNRATQREGGPLHLIATARHSELSPAVKAILRRFLDAGRMTLIELGPLEPEATRAMVTGIVPGAARLADALWQYTGGNPGFIRQTLEALLEQNMLERAVAKGRLPEGLVPPTGPTITICRRLERLSSAALQLLRLAAFAPEDFQPDLVTLALDLAPLEQAVLLEELETASLVRPHHFNGDLVAEVVRLETPPVVQTLLHDRIAHALERLGVHPERVRAHRLEAFGKPVSS